MAAKRAKERDLSIPLPKNYQRRLKALADPEYFLQTYFGDLFDEAFTDDRRDMLNSIVRAAKYGGDQAIAGPRGEGKTTLAMCGATYLMFAELTSFPVIIGKSQLKSQAELRDVLERLQQSELISADFPEIGVPFAAVGAWSSRARMQTVSGKSSRIIIKAEAFRFPRLTNEQLGWPPHIRSIANGQIMAAVGIDGPIRGTKLGGERPTIAVIDDIEDQEAAASDQLIEKYDKIIEKDIGGLGRSARRIPRVFLCTTQNRKCNAYRYTCPKIKPSWNGRRFRKMVKPPTRMDLVERYIELRQMRKPDDPDAREAYRFWRDNRVAIEMDCVVSNTSSFDKALHADGEPLELSAIQAYYSRVADFGAVSVATEIDNDPPEESGPQGSGLTAEIVASRLSGLAQCQLPANTMALTAAIDLGKYSCHWVVTAWWEGAGGCVVDYGIAEVSGNEQAMTYEASEPAIYKALLNWRDQILTKEYIDATGVRRQVNMAFVDSGAYTGAAYTFVHNVRGIFHCSKGISPYHRKAKSTETLRAGQYQHAVYFPSKKLWLYELDTDYWKGWVHERFLTPNFDDANMLRRGSLSIFSPVGNRRHTSYAQHIVAEELLTEFKPGKGTITKWHPRNDNNHWLDATYMAAACTETMGIGLIAPSEAKVVAKSPTPAKVQSSVPHGNRFRSRPGGWVQSLRRKR